MYSKTRQSGFSIIEVLLVVVVVGLLGYLGYRFYASQQPSPTASTVTTSAVANDVPAAPQISSTSDLDQAAAQLDQVDTSSSSDLAALDAQVQSF